MCVGFRNVVPDVAAMIVIFRCAAFIFCFTQEVYQIADGFWCEVDGAIDVRDYTD